MEKTEGVKNLSNCKLPEFLAQTNKIRKAAQKWLEDTEITAIMKRKPPELEKLDTKEERNAALIAQGKANIADALDSALGKFPEETAEILALCCFVEPEEMDNYKTSYFLTSFGELMNDEAVIGFFISLVQLVNMPISKG